MARTASRLSRLTTDASRSEGVTIVLQELSLIPDLSIAENIYPRPQRRLLAAGSGSIRATIRRRTRELFDRPRLRNCRSIPTAIDRRSDGGRAADGRDFAGRSSRDAGLLHPRRADRYPQPARSRRPLRLGSPPARARRRRQLGRHAPDWKKSSPSATASPSYRDGAIGPAKWRNGADDPGGN